MRPLKTPPFGVAEVIDSFGTGRTIRRVTALKAQVVAGEQDYLEVSRRQEWVTLSTRAPAIPTTEDAALRYAYTRMVDKEEAARSFYNVIESLAPNKKCPLCLERTTAALDHYLPKKHFARFAVVPANLVPICDACNDVKLSNLVTDPLLQPLHPYFDDLGGMEWLAGDFDKGPQAPMVYRPERQVGWSNVLFSRVEHHFTSLGLNELWSASSGAWLSANRFNLRKMYRDGDETTVRDALQDAADSYDDDGSQPWIPIAMRAWARSRWFCQIRWY